MAEIADIKLSPLEARFVKAFIETGCATTAAKMAGCKCSSDASFATRGSQLRRRLDLPIQQLMAAAGLDSLSILRQVARGMDAQRTHVVFDSDGNPHTYQAPHWQARARFTDMAIRLKGGYPKSNQLELPFEVQDGKLVITAEFSTNTPGGEAAA